MNLKPNTCTCERNVRVIVGLFLTSFTFWGPRSPWFLLGLVLVATGITGYCPIYALLGINRAQSCSPSTCCCRNINKKQD